MSIKGNLLGKLGTLSVATFFVTNAFADTLTLSLGPAGTQAGIGGEFQVSNVSGGLAATAGANYAAGVTAFHLGGGNASVMNSFETFCIEYNEEFSPGGNYNYAISSAAIKGGTTTGDPLSKGTALLYSEFAQGILPSYDYTPGSGRISTAGDLQNAIWWLEGEISLSTSQVNANVFLTGANGAVTLFGSEAAAKSDAAAGLYGVYAINLGPAPLFPNQDQLIYTGGGASPLPDGGATLLRLSAGFGGLAWLRRKLA